MSVNDEKTSKVAKNSDENKISFKKYVAIKTIKITANADFDLVEGQEIPKEINEALIKSLVSSNLIKLIK